MQKIVLSVFFGAASCACMYLVLLLVPGLGPSHGQNTSGKGDTNPLTKYRPPAPGEALTIRNINGELQAEYRANLGWGQVPKIQKM